jgi:hypothetical protein
MSSNSFFPAFRKASDKMLRLPPNYRVDLVKDWANRVPGLLDPEVPDSFERTFDPAKIELDVDSVIRRGAIRQSSALSILTLGAAAPILVEFLRSGSKEVNQRLQQTAIGDDRYGAVSKIYQNRQKAIAKLQKHMEILQTQLENPNPELGTIYTIPFFCYRSFDPTAPRTPRDVRENEKLRRVLYVKTMDRTQASDLQAKALAHNAKLEDPTVI